MTTRRWIRSSPGALAACLGGYVAVAVAFTWPLGRQLSTRLTGLPGSDLGVYLWNLWVFRREFSLGRLPLSTSSILSLDGPVDLSLHNYTIFNDLVALPLLPHAGLVATHNLIVLGNLVLAAVAMFFLALQVVRRPGIAWLAGLLFGFSPMMMARADIHPSLAAGAPLALFTLGLFRLHATGGRAWAVALGVTAAWAGVSDPYYAVYCLILACWFLWTRAVKVRVEPWQWRPVNRTTLLLDVAALSLAAVIVSVAMTGGFAGALGPVRLKVFTLYTPNLLLTTCVVARIALTRRPRFRLRPWRRWRSLVIGLSIAGPVAAVLLSPLLMNLASRWQAGHFVTPTVFWRTSTPGADLVSFFLPNPNHPWLGALTHDWLASEPGGYAENVTSVTVVALLVLLAAWRKRAFKVSWFWKGLALGAGSLALGPFLRVATVETLVPTPWAFLRYAPLIGVARSPARFAVLVSLAVSVLFAMALRALVSRSPHAHRLMWACGSLLIVELCPAPKLLHDGTFPDIYARIARDPREIRVIELPFGIRDGLSSFGDFSAASQFYQAAHGKRLVGGYLSRVSKWRVELNQRRPVLAVLMALSEGRAVPPAELAAASDLASRFLARTEIGYVVIDRSRASPELMTTAARLLDLEYLEAAGDRALYRPRRSAASAAVPAMASTSTIR